MLSREENERLCRVGPGTPMGQLMRRYWIPAALSTELVAGTPKRIRLLGESFVAFRGDDGVAGVLDELCPHRGASLVLARTEGCALRCLYHGWKIERSGAVTEMPAEPEGSAFVEKVRAVSYPVYESAGIVWTYLGAPVPAPPVPAFAYSLVPDSHRVNGKHRTDCNWTQSLEGAIDSAHSSFLHSSDIEGRPSTDRHPRLRTEDTPYGFRYAAERSPDIEPEHFRYVRVTHFVAPFTAVIPLGKYQNVQIFVPIDDEHTYQYNVKTSPEPFSEEQARRFRGGKNSDGDFGTTGNRSNNWLQDRAAMQACSFTGIEVIRNQDTAMQESMGAIFDRSREHLGTSDIAIIRMRRVMLDHARALEQHGRVPGLEVPFDYAEPFGVEGLLTIGEPWQRLMERTVNA